MSDPFKVLATSEKEEIALSLEQVLNTSPLKEELLEAVREKVVTLFQDILEGRIK